MDKGNIVEIAKTMFYDEGISNVSLKQIADKCGVAPSLLNYYFKNKSSIIAEVIADYSSAIDKVIADRLYEEKIPYDYQVVWMLSLLVKFDIYELDPKARTFYLEYLNCGMETIFSVDFIHIYKEIDKFRILDIDRSYDQLPSVATAAHGVLLSLMYVYYSGNLNCTYRQFVDYVLHLRCEILQIPKEEANKVIARAEELHELLSFIIKPYFVVE